MSDTTGMGTAVSRMQANIPVGPGLHGDLAVPRDPIGVTLFAHGSGSGRFSPRNRLVANALNRHGIATLLFDLLTHDEEAQQANVFDVELLGERLEQTTRWLMEHPLAEGLAPSYFGASTGAAAALRAAANLGPLVRAVVTRGGRPDLAGDGIEHVVSPTLLIVGSRDETVLDLNRQAYARLSCTRQLVVVHRAGHLFEEPGTLEPVAELTGNWLVRSYEEGDAAALDLGELETEPAATD